MLASNNPFGPVGTFWASLEGKSSAVRIHAAMTGREMTKAGWNHL